MTKEEMDSQVKHIIARANDEQTPVDEKIELYCKLFGVCFLFGFEDCVVPVITTNITDRERRFISEHKKEFCAYLKERESRRLPYSETEGREACIEGLAEVRSALNVTDLIGFTGFGNLSDKHRFEKLEKREKDARDRYSEKYPVAYYYSYIEYMSRLSMSDCISREAMYSILSDPDGYRGAVENYYVWAKAQIEFRSV